MRATFCGGRMVVVGPVAVVDIAIAVAGFGGIGKV